MRYIIIIFFGKKLDVVSIYIFIFFQSLIKFDNNNSIYLQNNIF